MEQRTPLSQGVSVQQFVIDRVIGYGASCLVYEAHYLDSGNHRKEIILKECYPYNSGTTRIGRKIVWSSTEEQEKAFRRFDNAYEIAAKIQNEAGAQSVSVYSLDKFAENGTQYVATIPVGKSYDKTKSDDLADIIRTALALTNAVGFYHQAGYLHLDIKPSNFIATEDQTGKGKNIVLFDVDTVAAQDDIQSGNLRSVSYSKEFAAPEQKMQQIKKLCPATDLYAVGAVLFERIMNRPADSSDSTLFATWEYDERFDAKKVNPKIKRLLTEVFHKTLAANVKRRYQTSEELSEALSKILSVFEAAEPYIISQIPYNNCAFVGRDNEIKYLRSSLEQDKKVFVSGSGGIGKSELVKHYISIYSDYYDSVVFLTYRSSVSDAINQIRIKGVQDYEQKRVILPELCDDKVLIILDNFDVSTDEDNSLNELLNLNCDTIITTRTDFSEVYPNIDQVTLKGLETEELRIVFENEADLVLSDDDFELLKPILHLGKECTFYWALLAKTVKDGNYDLKEIVSKTQKGLSGFDDTVRVLSNKDGLRIKQTVAKAISNLFGFDTLSDIEKSVIEIIYFLDCLKPKKEQLITIFKSDKRYSLKMYLEAFNDLLERRVIEEHYEYHSLGLKDSFNTYRFNDVIKDTITYSINPILTDNQAIVELIHQKFVIDYIYADEFCMDYELQEQLHYCFNCLFKMLLSAKNSDIRNIEFYVELIFSMLGGYFGCARSCYNKSLKEFLRLLSSMDRNSFTSDYSYIQAQNILATICSDICNPCGEEMKDMHFGFLKECCNAFHNSVAYLDCVELQNKDELVNILCSPIVYLGRTSVVNYLPVQTIKTVVRLNPSDPFSNHLSQDFQTRAFRNVEYEKYYLSETIKAAERLNGEKAKTYVFSQLKTVLLNSVCVTVEIDNELRTLRKQVIDICESKIKEFEEQNSTYSSPINFFENDLIKKGLNNYYISIDDDKLKEYQSHRVSLTAPKSDIFNPSYKFWKNNISEFNEKVMSLIEKIKNSETISNELQEESFKMSEEIISKLSSKEIIDNCPFYDSSKEIEYTQLEMHYYSTALILNCILGEKAETINNYFRKLVVSSLTYAKEKKINNWFINIDDHCFFETMRLLYQYGFSPIALSFLIDYTEIIEDLYGINEKSFIGYNSYDPRYNRIRDMFDYYDLIVKMAAQTLPPKEERLLIAIFGEETEDWKRYEKTWKIIRKYGKKLNPDSDTEFYP